jgi:hypothetical protein
MLALEGNSMHSKHITTFSIKERGLTFSQVVSCSRNMAALAAVTGNGGLGVYSGSAARWLA